MSDDKRNWEGVALRRFTSEREGHIDRGCTVENLTEARALELAGIGVIEITKRGDVPTTGSTAAPEQQASGYEKKVIDPDKGPTPDGRPSAPAAPSSAPSGTPSAPPSSSPAAPPPVSSSPPASSTASATSPASRSMTAGASTPAQTTSTPPTQSGGKSTGKKSAAASPVKGGAKTAKRVGTLTSNGSNAPPAQGSAVSGDTSTPVQPVIAVPKA